MLNCQEPSLTHQGMGGAQAKPSNNSSHSRGLDKLKLQNGYVGKGGNMHRESGRKYNSGNVSQKEVPFMPIETVELVDGLPKWLTDNVPRKVLSTLVVKSADSYDKLSKVYISNVKFYLYCFKCISVFACWTLKTYDRFSTKLTYF